jgi:hypothetical protein
LEPREGIAHAAAAWRELIGTKRSHDFVPEGALRP